jgi:hypothetical protein
MKPAFLITIDTEGDNLWSRPATIETRNADYLSRFQTLCERFGFKPTYLTNYEMACAPAFQELARDCIRRGTAEIGMHLHAWNSPPTGRLTSNDMHHQPYLVEYPAAVMRQKIEFMTRLLEDTFSVPVASHRAGRWALDSRYAGMLLEFGYTVDCSVTPSVSWRNSPGDPAGHGGADYRNYPRQAYFMDVDAPGQVGNSNLLQLPMTIHWPAENLASLVPKAAWSWPMVRRLTERRIWLRPDGRNIASMLTLLERETRAAAPFVEFMLHSSEFMPGGSHTFRSATDIDGLYADLEQLFTAVAQEYEGCTLAAYRSQVDAGQRPALRRPRHDVTSGGA